VSVILTVDTVPLSERREKQLPLPPPFSLDVEGDGSVAADSEPALTIFTIGHSNLEPEVFVALLRQHGLETLVDVRSAPYSRYAPHFSRGAIDEMLGDAGIRYVWAGDVLGGRPDDPACYRGGVVRRGNVDYDALARRPSYQQGIAQLVAYAGQRATAVMCSEEDPRRCHRHHLIEQTLRAHEAIVLHIRRDGTLETIESERPETDEAPITQLILIGV
jgi:uncharacterized protein (DUF488 family)